MAIAVKLHTRLGDLEEVQEEMVEPELMERWHDAAAGGGGNS